MNSTEYLAVLKNKQKELEGIKREIEFHEGDYTRAQAELYVNAAKICKFLDEEMGSDDSRWAELKERYKNEAEKIINYLKCPEEEGPQSYSSGRHSGGMGAGRIKDNNQDVVPEDKYIVSKENMPKHGFGDVTGMETVKEQLMGIKDDLKKEGLHKLLDMDPSSGMLFYGPPGCGKTFIIEAFVHELMEEEFSYLKVESKHLLGKYQGESEKNISAVFETAIKHSPCIMFLDEIDNLCINRDTKDIPVHKISITETFLNEYNNLKASGAKVYFMAATNYPQKVDTAMVDRMSLVRIGYPSAVETGEFIDRSLKKASLKLDNDMSIKEIAGYFDDNRSYRDMERFIDNVKREIIKIVKNLDDENAQEAIISGKVCITKAICEKALELTIFTPNADYFENLEKWEREMNIIPSSDKAGAKKGPDAAGQSRLYASTDSNADMNVSRIDAVLKKFGADNALKASVLKNGQAAAGDIDRKSLEFNADPIFDIYWSFVSAYYLMESCNESYEACVRYIDELQAVGSENSEAGKNCEEYIGGNYQKTRFFGFRNSSFANAYNPYFTLHQGHSVAGYNGTCGIISSCNVLNQQTGSRWDEADGVREFSSRNLCSEDGGTCPQSWADFLGERGVDSQFYEYDTIFDDAENNSQLSLEKMAERFRKGESSIIALHADDLIKKTDDIIKGRVTLSTALEEILKNPENYSQEVIELLIMQQTANHAVTVAGYSYDSQNNVTGVWINDTGGFSVWSEDGRIANRIFISKEKFDVIKENTDGFVIGYFKQKQ